MDTPGSGIHILNESEWEGYIKAFVFFGEELLVPSDNGNMTLWLRDKLERTVKVPSGPIYFMNLNKERKRIWLTNESGLYLMGLQLTC